MAIDDQPDQPILVTVPVAFEGGQQLVHLGFGQVLPDPVGIVRPASSEEWRRSSGFAVGRTRHWQIAVRACSVLQFHAIKALVPICDRGDGGATKTG
jgi:hypothetical protein